VGQFVQTNGDYTIKTGEGGTVKFDTGDRIGEVRVTGNLLVEGDTLTVSAENLNVNDNVIILNYGETGNGVTLRYSGVQVDRGEALPASIIYDENDDSWNFVNGSPEGVFTWANSKLRVKEILTDSDTDSGDLTLIGTGSGVVKVSGTVNYEFQVVDDDHIPNKKYVDDAIQSSPTFQIKSPDTGAYAGGQSGDSRIIIADKHVQPNTNVQPGSLNTFTDQTGYTTFGESAISVIVDGQLNTQFYDNRTVIQGLEFIGNEITNNDTQGNIYLRTFGTGKLQTNYAMELEHIVGTPAFVANSNILYAADPGLATTGIYYVNDSSEAIKRSGELINKNKALLFSMIF
jgi:hypothetical protein